MRKTTFSGADLVASSWRTADVELALTGSRLPRGWWRLKVGPDDGLRKIAIEAKTVQGAATAFEAVCGTFGYRGYVYVSDDIETLTMRMSADDPARVAVAMRPLWGIELAYKSLGRDLLRRPKAYLDYFLNPVDPFTLSHIFPAPPKVSDAYRFWIAEKEKEAERQVLGGLSSVRDAPAVSILLTVCDPPVAYLNAAIRSVLAQTSKDWELCIADDASVDPGVRRALQQAAAGDKRIKLMLRPERGGISAATNDAFALSSAPLVTCLDHDDLLAPIAIEVAARHFAAHPDCAILFSDEDKIDEHDNRFAPYFKPRRFSPELFHSYNYINHMTVHRADAIRAVGGWRTAYDGAQDYDLALRILKAAGPEHVHHVPLVLYHWRAIAGSAALSISYKPYAIEKGRAALEDYLAGVGNGAAVEVAAGALYRVRYRLPEPAPRVSIVVPFRDKPELLRNCVGTILAGTDYADIELILVDNGSTLPETAAEVARIATLPGVKVLRDDGPFNYSRLNNDAVRQATGAYVCLLNNDVEVTHRDWLADMMGYATQPGVGCVGAKLYYPVGTIQHAGVIIGIGGIASHAFLNAQKSDLGYFARLAIASNYSAVTGACVLVKRTIYEELGGLDECLAVAYNDIDFCLRAMALGYRNVFTPFAELTHWESASRGAEDTPEKAARFRVEAAAMKARHAPLLTSDPFYSPHLSLKHTDYSIAD